MALYDVGASTTMNVTPIVSIFHPSSKYIGKVMALLGKWMSRKFSFFSVFFSLFPKLFKASRKKTSIELVESIMNIFTS